MKSYNERDTAYKYMSKSVGGQSQPQPYHEDIDRNEYENTRKGYKPEAWDWSGMRK